MADLIVLVPNPLAAISRQVWALDECGSGQQSNFRQQARIRVNAFGPGDLYYIDGQRHGLYEPSIVCATSLSHVLSMAGREDHDEGAPSAPGDAADVPLPFRRPPLLPKNLEATLRHLDEDELARLLAATMAEHERRGLVRSDAGQPEPVRENVARKEEPATGSPSIEGLTQAQVNLVQAAFKAGVKPSAIARQFGISPKSIQKVLAKKGR